MVNFDSISFSYKPLPFSEKAALYYYIIIFSFKFNSITKQQTMKKLLLFCMFSVWLISLAVAQRQVSGTVTDFTDQQVLPGVNVLIQGTSAGTVTDIDGNYSIEIPNDDAVLVISFIGYETYTVP